MAQTNRQTDKQTSGHGDSMTNSAQWGRVGENLKLLRERVLHYKRVLAHLKMLPAGKYQSSAAPEDIYHNPDKVDQFYTV